MQNSPRTLIYDIETSFNLVATFQLKVFGGYIPSENIIQERHLISFAYKWLGEKKISAVSLLDDPKRFKRDCHDDTFVVGELHKILSLADCIVGHNGDGFDLPFAEGRMLHHHLPPLPPMMKIDTLKAARKRFLLNANNLAYLGQFLGVGGKVPTEKGLWLEVLKGDREAIKRMVEYNKGDVRLLEKVFLILRPYIDHHVNTQLFGAKGCPRCGSLRVQKRGFHKAVSQTYQRYCCSECGGWFRDGKASGGVPSRVL